MLEFAVTMRAGRQDSLEPAADLLGYALTLNNEAAGEREQLDDKESHGEPAATQLEENAFDVVSCIGATWIGDGVPGTLRLMRPALRGRGLLLIGEPFWLSEPPPEAYAALHVRPDEFTSLLGTCDRLAAGGADLVEMVLADQASWDRYVAAQWWTIEQWLHANPDPNEAAEMRRIANEARRSHLEFGRAYLGWGVFVCRPK
jgi:hypothetical protein